MSKQLVRPSGHPHRAAIHNPILRGFNPDPSIVRQGRDYYIATSTFEWFPGVQIHHSQDLVNWRLLTRPLDRISQLDLAGVPDSGGVWAPCLTCCDGCFYLVYSIVYELNSRMKDVQNFLVTSDRIEGPWSEPIQLNGSGFDPSLFHAPDGRKWLLNMVWDHRPGRTHFNGIALQEFCLRRKRLVGEPRIIFRGTSLDYTEGPHLFIRKGYFYLIVAEGGTGWDHAVTVARSRQLVGPYEVCPHNPILTSQHDPNAKLQKAGHADFVETSHGQWYMVHLCSRPLPYRRSCMLGRETAIQRIEWDENDWPHVEGNTCLPHTTVALPEVIETTWPTVPTRDEFDTPTLAIQYQTPRRPLSTKVCSSTERRGVLRIRGGQSLASRFKQSIVARRLDSFRSLSQTGLEFKPTSFQQMAGIVCYYSTRLFHYLCVSHNEAEGRCLYIQSNDCGKISFPLGGAVVPLSTDALVHLRAEIDGAHLQFSYSEDGEKWTRVGSMLDASILSDDYGDDWGFTGAFVGMACQDLTCASLPADFHYFEYQQLDGPE